MTQRSERRSVFVEKRELSKYETAIESAFKQKKIYTASVDDSSTLTYVPDVIVVPDQVNDGTNITLPTRYFDEDKQVTIANQDSGEAVTIGGVACFALSITVIYFNGTAWTLVYSQTGVRAT